MGVINLPPPPAEYAQARDAVERYMAQADPIGWAEVKMISHNLKERGTVSQQEAFRLTWLEILGKQSRKEDVSQAMRAMILDNPAYAPFKTAVAGSDDPLLR